jgi:UDP-N-acetylmuramoyl-L-alanyl-D-glutamate--2,6-diaminopimelate ligase
VKLCRLLGALAQAKPLGPTDLDITSLSYDSRTVAPGALFVAITGYTLDGHQFVPEACRRGARAVVAERPVAVPPAVTLIQVPDSRQALSSLAAAFYGHPSEKLDVVGITGTNGKTTTAYLIHSILQADGRAPALLTTVEEWLGQERRPARWTTPESLELQGFFAGALAQGHRAVSMEVSSQGLVGHRVDDVRFRAAVFTNLAPEHLDFHKTMEAYGEAKAVLFRGLAADGLAVLNANEPFSRYLAGVTRARRVTYAVDAPADVHGEVLAFDASGTRFLLEVARVPGRRGRARRELRTPLVGRHNATNCVAAVAAAWGLGVPMEAIVAGVEALTRVPGRLEPVDVGQPFAVLVDYAHTDHALVNVLEAVRALTRGRLILVFGCGGDRDRTKRPRMGAVAERGADLLWVTSDNPRSEAPRAIIEEILAGVAHRDEVHVEPDRAEAIGQALASAQPGDLVLIAGKGHEAYQIVGIERRPFDDRLVAREALSRLGAAPKARGGVR